MNSPNFEKEEKYLKILFIGSAIFLAVFFALFTLLLVG
jgi:hypothetical protein